MAWVTFNDWWRREENQQDFWRISKTGVAVSLGETPRSIFWQILQLLKGYHDREVGYGNLLEGVLIGENKQVQLRNYDQPNPEPFASIKKDFLDFKKLVTEVEERISTVQGVQPAYSSRKFHDLYGLLDHYSNSVDGLRRFGFFMRNSPLFLDDTAKYLFFKKVLTIKEYDVLKFQTAIELRDLEGWAEDVNNEHLAAVKKYKPGKHKEKPHQSADNSTSESANNSTSQSTADNSTSQSTADNSTSQHSVAVKKYKGGKHKEKPHQSPDNSTSETGGSHRGGNLTSRSGKGKNKLGQSGPKNRSGGNTPSHGGNPTNRSIYEKPDGSISFFRNCLGHMREHNGGTIYHDAKILHALEDDLPKVIPVWFYDLVRELGLNIQKCTEMCGGYSWMEFLSMQPTVFT